jgi:A/G-specific adenine glycosylase
MLQQTQVMTVIPYYQRFIQRFPNIQSLAQASLDEVLALWSGLGYYARARHLYQAACLITKDHHGIFPQHMALMQLLPGIGRSTAAAIAVFSFGERCAILDGNVKRVFSRYFGIDGYPGNGKTQALLWQKTNEMLPRQGSKDRIKTYTQALMDFGSIVCTRSKPNCAECPLQQNCVAFKEKRVDKLPVSKPHKPLPKRETVFLMLIAQDKILFVKRPATGIWGGLWCPPEMAVDENAATYCAQQYGIKVRPLIDMPPLNHTFTHFKLRIHPLLLKVVSSTVSNQNNGKWIALNDALSTAIPTPVRKLLLQKTLSNNLATRKNHE